MKNPWIIPTATLCVGILGGYFSGKTDNPSSLPANVEEAATRTRSMSRSETSLEESTRRSKVPPLVKIGQAKGNSAQVQAMLEFYQSLSASQLAEEAAKLDSLPMSERLVASVLLFGRWAEVDPQAAMAFSNTMGMAGGFVRPTVLKSWASVDPASAAKYYTENPRQFAMMAMGGRGGPMGNESGAAIIASQWAQKDPAAAMAWAASLTADKGQAMNAVITEMAKTDPQKAAAMIKQMDAADQAAAYTSVADKFGSLDFAGAQSWIRTLPADQQAAAMASAIGGLAKTDPERAAREISAMAAGDDKNRMMSQVVRELARKDPAAAGALLRGQADEGVQRDGMRELLPSWVGKNPAEALAFVNSCPAGRVYDSAVQAYVWSNTSSPPRDLIQIAETVGDEGDRNRMISVAGVRWIKEDPVAARAYISASTYLPDDAKERVLSGQPIWGGGWRGRGN
jgi:hypothetical protein